MGVECLVGFGLGYYRSGVGDCFGICCSCVFEFVENLVEGLVDEFWWCFCLFMWMQFVDGFFFVCIYEGLVVMCICQQGGSCR